jgi:hypothetical protein
MKFKKTKKKKKNKNQKHIADLLHLALVLDAQ